MRTEEKTEKSGKKIFLIIIVAIVAAFMVYFTIMSMVSPRKKLAEMEAEYSNKESQQSSPDGRFYSDSGYVGMLKGKAFIQAKISMAESDSVSLSLNLADSTADLEISGVKVHSAKMTRIRISKILLSGNPATITSMLSSPLNIVRDYATIKKEPLMIKMAPKDTSEFKPDIIPDTSDYEPVNYILETDAGIRVVVFQEEEVNPSDRRHLFFFDLNDRIRVVWNSIKDIAAFRIPDYKPYIRIRLNKTDAKVIYRAIPRKGQIAVYI